MKSKNTKRYVTLGSLIIGSLAFVGCGEKVDPHAGHDHGAAGAVAESGSVLSPEALAGLGLQVQPIEKTTFVRYETVQAIAALPPLSVQPLVAPVSGRIVAVHCDTGARIDPNQPVVTLVRDPLPRVQLTLTEDLLKPASEESHETAVNLRKALAELEIVEAELQRLKGLETSGRASLVPRQTVIDLQYQHTRAVKEVDLLKSRLRMHGMSDEDIAAMAEGKPIHLSDQRWRASLEANGLWSPEAKALYESLSEPTRNLPWNVAAIGELGALGMLTPALQSWVKETPDMGTHFMFVAGMLQSGHSLADVKNLHDLGALEDTVGLKAPDVTRTWDVQSLQVRPGERVAAGDSLVTLIDPSRLYLKIKPAGRELAQLRAVIKSGRRVAARPLIKNAGLSYRDLLISHLQSEGEDQHAVATLSISNQVLQAEGNHRTWAVQPGTRYIVELPIEEMRGVWVLPREAIAEEGADSVVFVENGDSFTPVKVTVLFSDDQVAVIGPKSGLFPGDPVVTRNAFGLALALNSGGSSAVDPHAGHSH
jgi:multidrug efflux pump subunit AcrA (membrane-fusion protein)